MVFKGRVFSSKKSDTSTPDGSSNCPPTRPDQKNLKSLSPSLSKDKSPAASAGSTPESAGKGLLKKKDSSKAQESPNSSKPSSGPASERSPLQNTESSSAAATGQFDSSLGDSGALSNSDACTPEMKTSYECENTSPPRKRFPGHIKSFSLELNSKCVRAYPFWKPRRLNNLEEVLAMVRTKFDKAKEEVDSDLHIFAADLVGLLEKNAETHPEWQETIEDLLLLARSCAMTSPGEFWLQCEGIVQELDDRRQELPMGMLKQLHTRILFILTRCTRLLQFHKESGLAEDERVFHLRQSLQPVDKQVPRGPERDANQRATSEAEQGTSKVPELHPSRDGYATSSRPKHQHEDSWGYLGDQPSISDESSIICGIADQKGLKVNERLTRIADTLEKLMESFSAKDMQHAGSPDGAQVSNSSVTEESELLSPKYWSRSGSEDVLDCFAEADNNGVDDMKVLPSMSCKSRTEAQVPLQLGMLREQAIVLLGPTQDFLDLVVYRTPGELSISAWSGEVVLEDEDEPKEWTAQVEPGVQITFVSLPRGGNELKRIRFSREIFNKWQAQRWWGENFDRIMVLYNVQRFNQQAMNTPGRSEDGDVNAERLG